MTMGSRIDIKSVATVPDETQANFLNVMEPLGRTPHCLNVKGGWTPVGRNVLLSIMTLSCI